MKNHADPDAGAVPAGSGVDTHDPEPAKPANYQDGYDAGYKAGYDVAAQEAELARRPPLFEAAKAVAENHFDAADADISERYLSLEDAYGYVLSAADKRVLAAVVQRRRVAAEAQRQALLQAKPKSVVGRDVAARLAEAS